MSDASRTTARPDRLPLVLAVVAALALIVPCAMLTGAAAAPALGLSDPGVLVRWGLPVVRSVHDLAAALTVGLLVLAATVIPESRGSNRRITATRWASGAGVVWVVSALVELVFSMSDISGVSPGDPTFGAQFQTFVLSLETTRVAAISLGIALVVASGAALVRSRGGVVALAVLAVGAMLPLALAGHAAGAADHDTSVNSLAVHLVAVAIWVGGLLALAVLRPVLGDGLAVSVQRYSTLAGWCFGAVAVSGVLNAWVRVGSLKGLASSYGVLVLLKAAALVALGLAGFQQRRTVVGRLAVNDRVRWMFARLTLVELTIMSAAIGIATVLARSAPPVPATPSGRVDPAVTLTGYPAPSGPLTASGWFTVWRVDWLWLALAVVGVGLYLGGVVRLRRRGDSWPVLRTVAWVAGWLVFVWATSGAPGVYGRVQFSVHMTLHMTISMVTPILLVLAAPVTLGLRTLKARSDGTLGPRELLLAVVHSRLLAVLGNPVVAAVIFFGSLVVFYYSPLFDLALRTHTGHLLMVTHFLLAGYLFAWVLIGVDPGPRRWAPSMRLVVLFATISFHAFFGVALTTGTTLLAPDFFHQLALPWLPDLLADQRIGGAVAWGIGELPSLALAMFVTLDWVRSDDAEARRRDRQADRDDDAELKAYNARFAAAAARARDEAPHPSDTHPS